MLIFATVTSTLIDQVSLPSPWWDLGDMCARVYPERSRTAVCSHHTVDQQLSNSSTDSS